MPHNQSIFLVDDHTILRTALKQLIEKLGPYQVISEFANGEELLTALKKGETADLIILDLQMPVMDGQEVMEQICILKISVPVLVLTMDSSEKSIVRLFMHGARGYLRKDCSAEEMKKAIDDILSSGYYHNEFSQYSSQLDPAERKDALSNPLSLLSDRELDFLKLVCDEKEYTYEEIADAMHLHFRTIDGYRASIFKKLNIKSKTGLVLFIIKNKLLERLQGN